MHPLILGSGLLALAVVAPATLAGPAPPACPAARAPVHEAFLPADCATCWASAEQAPASGGWRFDWVLPGLADAALAAAALPEAADRAARAALGAQRPASHLRPGHGLRVASGPAWKGYFGLQLSLLAPASPAWPAGATAWLALVELVPAGSDGSPMARALVRSVAGPLPLGPAGAARKPLTHLRAMRWPDAAQPTRLQARAWIEDADGHVLAVAADRCP